MELKKHNLESKRWREECALFGIWGDPQASQITYLGLYAQQHRGQESTGMVSYHEGKYLRHKGMGLVGEVYGPAELEKLKGDIAIGHTRYSTTGENLISNIQPLVVSLKNGPFAIAHNGNLTNGKALREELILQGAIFQGTNDTEIILHLLAKNSSDNIIQAIQQTLSQLDGAFSLICMSQDKLIAVRDPLGFRPLVLGKRPVCSREAMVVASETCAFDLMGAEYVREIEPGEIYWVDKKGEHSKKCSSLKTAKCIFEHVYFARPDSKVFGKSVYETRKKMGSILARENPISGDIVVPVPDSGVPAAIGYSTKSGIPFELGIVRNHYVGRTFIQPSPSIRSLDVKIKLNPQRQTITGKKIVVIDDSLVRGTTSQKIIRLLRQFGAREIHLQVASPPIIGCCYYGVDTPQDEELIAYKYNTEQICKFIGADSLYYLSLEGMVEAVSGKPQQPSKQGFCASCFDRKYLTPIEKTRHL